MQNVLKIALLQIAPTGTLSGNLKKGIYPAQLGLTQLRRYCDIERQGNTFRHPEKYGILTQDRVEYPFIR